MRYFLYSGNPEKMMCKLQKTKKKKKNTKKKKNKIKITTSLSSNSKGTLLPSPIGKGRAFFMCLVKGLDRIKS